ncbi:Branched-chain amino acid ABC transporter, amino acid-binding protein [Caballeronia sordidicola]|uniref:Branched-chain amino acid ABC transporter, amino acid-binding protein n=1 Tax=Caballeronia sordidicola TaxID=196367 RepID=A0A226WZ51_CABSO|nr:Branched-chain amino acid ABC transporter, amino acid-binding protein [Caballeronia sordidicola]
MRHQSLKPPTQLSERPTVQNLKLIPIVLTVLVAAQPLLAHADVTVKIGQVSPLTGELSHIGKDDENWISSTTMSGCATTMMAGRRG